MDYVYCFYYVGLMIEIFYLYLVDEYWGWNYDDCI